MPSTAKRSIVIVDNNQSDIELIKQTVVSMKLDATVMVFDKCVGIEQLLAASILPDVIVYDINICKDSTNDGFDLVRKIRSHYYMSQVPVVIFTYSNDPQDINNAYLLESSYIIKPRTIDEMSNILGIITKYWDGLVFNRNDNLNKLRELTFKLETK